MEWDNKTLHLNNPTTIPYKVTIYLYIHTTSETWKQNVPYMTYPICTLKYVMIFI